MSDKKILSIKKVMKKTDIDSMIDLMIELLSTYGQFAITVGAIQKNYGKAFEAFKTMGQSPQFLSSLTKNVPPEILGLFMQILMSVTAYTDDLANLMNLPPEKQIKVGKALKKTAEDIKKLRQKVEKSRGEKE